MPLVAPPEPRPPEPAAVPNVPLRAPRGRKTRQQYALVEQRPDVVREHEQSSNHRAAVLGSNLVGCFHCTKIYSPREIEDWTDEDENGIGQTAMCVRCGIDAVIPIPEGIDSEFLSLMRRRWF